MLPRVFVVLTTFLWIGVLSGSEQPAYHFLTASQPYVLPNSLWGIGVTYQMSEKSRWNFDSRSRFDLAIKSKVFHRFILAKPQPIKSLKLVPVQYINKGAIPIPISLLITQVASRIAAEWGWGPFLEG